jgi:hypothetical protein
VPSGAEAVAIASRINIKMMIIVMDATGPVEPEREHEG